MARQPDKLAIDADRRKPPDSVPKRTNSTCGMGMDQRARKLILNRSRLPAIRDRARPGE